MLAPCQSPKEEGVGQRCKGRPWVRCRTADPCCSITWAVRPNPAVRELAPYASGVGFFDRACVALGIAYVMEFVSRQEAAMLKVDCCSAPQTQSLSDWYGAGATESRAQTPVAAPPKAGTGEGRDHTPPPLTAAGARLKAGTGEGRDHTPPPLRGWVREDGEEWTPRGCCCFCFRRARR